MWQVLRLGKQTELWGTRQVQLSSKGGVTEGSVEEVTLKRIPKNDQGLATSAGGSGAGQTGLCEHKEMSSVWVASVHSIIQPTFTEHLLSARYSSRN